MGIPRAITAFTAVALLTVLLVGFNVVGVYSGDSQYIYSPATYIYTASEGVTTTQYVILSTQASECQKSWLQAISTKDNLRGGGILYGCVNGTVVVVIRFNFVVERNESTYHVEAFAWKGNVEMPENPLGLVLVFSSGYHLVLERPSGGNVSIEAGDRYEVTWSGKGLPEFLEFKDIKQVKVWAEVLLNGSNLHLEAWGVPEYYEPICDIRVVILLNRTNTRVELPEGIAHVTIRGTRYYPYFVVTVYQEKESYASIEILISTRESLLSNISLTMPSIIEWVAEKGLVTGFSLEDAKEIGHMLLWLIQGLCEPWGSGKAVIYWNGTSWTHISPEQITGPLLTPTPAPTRTTTASTPSVTTIEYISTTSPSVAETEEHGIASATHRYVEEATGGLLSEQQGTTEASRAFGGTPLVTGVALGLVAALVTWMLVRRL